MSRPACPTGRSGSTSARRRLGSSPRSMHPPSSTAWPRAFDELAAQLDGATVVPLRKAIEPGAPPMVVGDTRFLPTVELTRRIAGPGGERELPRRIAALCRHACGAQVPRNRPRHDRSGHGLPRRPQRHRRRARHPELHERRGLRRHERPEDRHRPASVRRRQRTPAQPPTSSRSTVSAATAGSRFRPAGSSSRAGP